MLIHCVKINIQIYRVMWSPSDLPLLGRGVPSQILRLNFAFYCRHLGVTWWSAIKGNTRYVCIVYLVETQSALLLKLEH